MYFVLYDRHLQSIGETYVLESWSRISRAIDFDETKIVGEMIPYWAEPFFVVANDKQGHLLFSGLASTPKTDEKTKKTTIPLKDFTTLFNSDIVVDWSLIPTEGLTLETYFDKLLRLWVRQVDIGFSNILWDASALRGVLWDEELPLGEGKESVLLYSLIQDAMNLYSVYCTPVLNLQKKTLTFMFYPQGTLNLSIRLRDFDIAEIEKSFGDYNRACVYDPEFKLVKAWGLTEDNSVVSLPTTQPLVYPAKSRNFVQADSTPDALYDAMYSAVMGLANNRYQENIDLVYQKGQSIIDLSPVDFSYSVTVYTDNGLYKKLPVGEIETDSKGKRIIRLGHRVQELTQEV